MSDPSNPNSQLSNHASDADAAVARHRTRRDEARSFNKTSIMDALDAAGIATVVISFDGYADSGQIENLEVDGATSTLPNVDVAFRQTADANGEAETRTIALREALQEIVYDLLDGGWQDGEGSYGDVTFDATVREITLDLNERYVGSNNSIHTY